MASQIDSCRAVRKGNFLEQTGRWFRLYWQVRIGGHASPTWIPVRARKGLIEKRGEECGDYRFF